ncbi:MAG: glycogen/starch/alpha-glucan phosphorylase [Candidatus Omnitrophica bacterium]|nr:glycogen/starch/alpha-glucan phosphorylase [Candidatus Omnitrophota bacterium]
MKRLSLEQAEQWLLHHKGMKKEDLIVSFKSNRQYILSKDQYSATANDNYNAIALSIRDRIVERWIASQQRYHKENVKRVYYLSLEFLIGRLLGNNMYNLGLEDEVKAAMTELGFDLDELREEEVDAGLGNGGLGRLAACFLDSMATLGIPCHGYGIRYDYGIFNQKIENGYQVERPDEWLRLGSPWEFARLEYAVPIKFYGKISSRKNEHGNLIFEWTDTSDVLAVPYDIPVVGYKNDVVNTLRLWSARSTEDFDFGYFNSGDYESAVLQKIYSENISKVLYPNDQVSSGQELRLRQQYFFVAASIADIIRRFRTENKDLTQLPTKVVIQLNDTHPTLAIPELMRVLLDQEHFEWGPAWSVVQKVFAYTNHTLMPEALECWPVSMMENLLPRHMQIIYEINRRFLESISTQFPGNVERLRDMSIIQEGDVKKVRMAHLAVAGSFSVNGVSALHTELLKTRVLKDFYVNSPEKFNNKTNGITQRRWLLKSNPALSKLITEKIGDGWIKDLQQLKQLEKLLGDSDFVNRWQAVKLKNKKDLAKYIEKTQGIVVDPTSLFDVQVKRIHEYKRQLLFALFILEQYLRLKYRPDSFIQPRTFIIGGKAAPGYQTAKLIIKFINNIAHVVNADKSIKGLLKVVFLENYRVSLAERVFPASELSEQISLAGTEASGTGNMKFMINGALTAGTYDGANIEMAEQAGMDNIFIFGLRTPEVEALRHKGYIPQDHIVACPALWEVIALIESNYFSLGETDLFRPLTDSLRWHDPYMICADFQAYCNTQEKISLAYRDATEWNKKSILNVARSGFFSSDRTINEYAKNIWFK